MRRRDGFPDQTMYVVPRPYLETIRNHPLLKSLIPTDIGWFPTAYNHYRERPHGSSEHILILCTQGFGWYQIDGSQKQLAPFEALLIPKNTAHIYAAKQDDPWSIHWVHFIGEIGDYFVEQCRENNYHIPIDPMSLQVVENLFEMCRNAFIANFVQQHMLYASQVLHHLLGCIIYNNRAFSPVVQHQHVARIDHVLSYLHEHVQFRLSLDDMANQAGLSRSHFVRLFKAQTKYAPMDYFIRLKIQHACMRLSFSDKTVREISFELGYDDPYYFSRLFKKTLGVSPTAYRTGTHSGFDNNRNSSY